jgi:hypothetical protein
MNTQHTIIHQHHREAEPPLKLYDVAAHACVGYSAGTRTVRISDKHPIHAEIVEGKYHGYKWPSRMSFHFKDDDYFTPPPNHLDRIVCGWSEIDMLDTMGEEYDDIWRGTNARRDPPQMTAHGKWICQVCGTAAKKRSYLMSWRHLRTWRHLTPVENIQDHQ